MAEQNQEITYIPYGQDEISQQDLMTNLANGVSGYLDSKRWARKDKYRQAWLNAYQNIINAGLTGASNESGIWTVNHRGEAFPLENMSNIDREMYQDAAWYIQQQMAKMTPRSKQEEKKEDKNLEKFDFVKGFNTQLINNRYGGNQNLFADSEEGWNSLDVRGKNGLRGIDKRKEAMIQELDSYLKGLEGKNYNFEGTSFTDINDAKTKIQKAIDALKSEDINDDTPALNALGLSYRTYFSNGGNDASGYADKAGNPLTWNDYNKYQEEQAKAKIQADAEVAKQKLAQQRANQYTNFKFYQFNLAGTPLTPESSQNLINKLNSGQDLDGNDISGLNWAFKQAMKSGGLQNLSKEELSKFGSRYAGTPSRLKKLPGLEGVYYDSIANRIIRPYRQDQQQVGGTTLQTLIDQNSPESLTKKQEENKLKAANRKLDNGWETEDYLRMGAMAQDIAGGITAWAGPYGMAASGILGLTSLGTNMAADIADESLSKWDVAKNAGVNLGLAAVGVVPGLGLASKTGKWITNIAKWAPRLLTLQAIKDLPESYNALQKAINNPKELTNADWKNIAYGLSIVAGLSRGTKGIVNNRKYKPTVTQNTETETFITTKSGNKIKATQKQVDTINKAGRKGGNDKANEELRKLPGAKADDEVNINFKTGIKGKADPTNKIVLDHSTKNIGQSPEVQRYSRALAIKNIRDKAAHPFLSKYLPTNYDIYQNAARVSAPNINIVDRFKQAWNPVSNKPFKGKQQSSTPTSTSTNTPSKTSTGSNAKPKQSVLSKAESQELKSTLQAKNFSTNEFKNESRVVGSVKGFGDLYGIRNSDGTHTLQIDFGGTRINITGTKADIKGKTLEVLRKDVMKKIDSQIPKEKRSRIKFDLIRKLKQEGYLKQGGTINPSLDTIIEDFIKNNNI